MQEMMLGALLILAIAWLVVRIRQNKAAATAKPPPSKPSGAYHAVAIQYSENACHAAKSMTGRRFLSTAAPHLPLTDCDYPDCHCRFVHYDDRRTGRDRRSPFAQAGTTGGSGTFEQERRGKSDRRQDPDDEHF